MPELLALTAALCIALSQIVIKFATQTGTLLLGLVISLATSVAGVGIVAAMTTDSWTLPSGTLTFFAVGGVIGPGAGRILAMRAVRDVGTSVAVPVQMSIYPLVASLAGIVLFRDAVGLHRMLGIAFVVGGVWSCVHGGTANREVATDMNAVARQDRRVPTVALLLPISSGIAYALSDTMSKVALASHNVALLGALVSLASALAVWLTLFLLITRFREPVRITPAFGWFCLSGLLSAAALVSLFLALSVGDLSVVSPILASQPVIVLALAALLLRHQEEIRIGTVAGGFAVFIGVVMVSIS